MSKAVPSGLVHFSTWLYVVRTSPMEGLMSMLREEVDGHKAVWMYSEYAQTTLDFRPAKVLLQRLGNPALILLHHVRQLEKLVLPVLDGLELSGLEAISKLLVFLSKCQISRLDQATAPYLDNTVDWGVAESWHVVGKERRDCKSCVD